MHNFYFNKRFLNKWPLSVTENTLKEVIGLILTFIALTSSMRLNLKNHFEDPSLSFNK